MREGKYKERNMVKMDLLEEEKSKKQVHKEGEAKRDYVESLEGLKVDACGEEREVKCGTMSDLSAREDTSTLRLVFADTWAPH